MQCSKYDLVKIKCFLNGAFSGSCSQIA